MSSIVSTFGKFIRGNSDQDVSSPTGMSADAQLAAVIQRLEAATIRLETLAKTGAPAAGVSADATGTSATSAAAPASASAPAPAVAAFDERMAGPLRDYLALSATVGGLVKEQSEHVEAAIKAQRRIIEIACASRKPPAATVQEIIKPLQQAIAKVTEIKEKNRQSPLFNHLSTVADGIPALGWVVVEPAPAPYVNDMKDSAQFYANRVIKEKRESLPAHAEWATSFITVIEETYAYNPELRATSVVKAADLAPKADRSTPASAPARGPAKLALEGSKWRIENQVGRDDIVLDQTAINHVIYIYNCQSTTIQIKGKVNAVVIDGCKKVGVVMDNVVSTVDIVNCKSVQAQVTGRAPTILIDKTDGVQLYIAKTARDVEIFSAKSSEMNVLVQGDDDEFAERPVPEQFKTVIVKGALVTEPVVHNG
eukprot:jgi/Hompol1/1528/HPOL_004974-RA